MQRLEEWPELPKQAAHGRGAAPVQGNDTQPMDMYGMCIRDVRKKVIITRDDCECDEKVKSIMVSIDQSIDPSIVPVVEASR